MLKINKVDFKNIKLIKLIVFCLLLAIGIVSCAQTIPTKPELANKILLDSDFEATF